MSYGALGHLEPPLALWILGLRTWCCCLSGSWRSNGVTEMWAVSFLGKKEKPWTGRIFFFQLGTANSFESWKGIHSIKPWLLAGMASLSWEMAVVSTGTMVGLGTLNSVQSHLPVLQSTLNGMRQFPSSLVASYVGLPFIMCLELGSAEMKQCENFTGFAWG